MLLSKSKILTTNETTTDRTFSNSRNCFPIFLHCSDKVLNQWTCLLFSDWTGLQMQEIVLPQKYVICDKICSNNKMHPQPQILYPKWCVIFTTGFCKIICVLWGWSASVLYCHRKTRSLTTPEAIMLYEVKASLKTDIASLRKSHLLYKKQLHQFISVHMNKVCRSFLQKINHRQSVACPFYMLLCGFYVND